jgi:hypothetical protein
MMCRPINPGLRAGRKGNEGGNVEGGFSKAGVAHECRQRQVLPAVG